MFRAQRGRGRAACGTSNSIKWQSEKFKIAAIKQRND